MTEAVDATEQDKPEAVTQPAGIPFADLREGRCKFPLGGPGAAPERFCGADTPPGAVYCLKCQAIAYVKPIYRRR